MRLKTSKGKKSFFRLFSFCAFYAMLLAWLSLCTFFCFFLGCVLFESPQLGSCKYRCAYMNRVVATSVFSTFTLQELFSFFILFSWCAQKAQENIKRLQANKNKKGASKTFKGKKVTYSLICAFRAFCAFCVCKIFS